MVSGMEGFASVVAEGPFEGRSLRGLMLSEQDALIGRAPAADDGGFPLLLKYIDAQQNLSVQVHPDAEAAKSLGSTPKSECWYILEAEAEAEIFLGLADGVDATHFAQGAASPDVVDLLQRHRVRTGDFVDVPAGTVHSIGEGIAIVEVQNASNTTYRIYDWERTDLDGNPRETHLDEALMSIDYASHAQPPGPLDYGSEAAQDGVNRSAPLRRGNIFDAHIIDVNEPIEVAQPGLPTSVIVLSGSGRLLASDDSEAQLVAGSAWVMPADLESARIVDADGDLRILLARPNAPD